MSIWTLGSLVAVFGAIASLAAMGASALLSWTAPERRRLRAVVSTAGVPRRVLVDAPILSDTPHPALQRAAQAVRKSPSAMSRVTRRMMLAGIRSPNAPLLFALAEIALPAAAGLLCLLAIGVSVAGLLIAAFATVLGGLAPGMWLDARVRARRKAIEVGLPDALDLLVVCIEAGSSLDQAVMKTAEELVLAHPAVAEEFSTITTELRAGQPRAVALKHFAERTKLDEVRTLTAMLSQTDRFGTSIAQALRTHADSSRIKRRQRAEERAAKVGVKLVFPLVLCLFPAFYVVTLGPAIIQFVRILFTQVAAIR